MIFLHVLGKERLFVTTSEAIICFANACMHLYVNTYIHTHECIYARTYIYIYIYIFPPNCDQLLRRLTLLHGGL